MAKVVAKYLPPLPTIRELIRIYNLSALKQLSQNFLMDLRLTDKIVRAAGKIKDGEVCEVGPGPGGITRSIIDKSPSRLVLIEKDRRFKPVLQLLADASINSKIDIIIDDVMTFNMSEIFSPHLGRDWYDDSPNIHLIGNLPFSVSTPLIIKWLHAISQRTSAWSYGRTKMTLTFQKEVAERMVAEPGYPNRCRLSVMCQNWCDVYFKFIIPGKAFVPKPDVDVGVVHFVPKIKPLVEGDFEMFEKFLRTLFNFKRRFGFKTACNLFPESERDILLPELYGRAGLNATLRSHEMTNEQLAVLFQSYKYICDRNPSLYNYDYRGPKSVRESDWVKDDEF